MNEPNLSDAALAELLTLTVEVNEYATCYRNHLGHWYQNGLLHRIHGPAIIYSNGTKKWYQNGKRHRTDGPAIEWPDGRKEWYLNDQTLTEVEFNERIKSV